MLHGPADAPRLPAVEVVLQLLELQQVLPDDGDARGARHTGQVRDLRRPPLQRRSARAGLLAGREFANVAREGAQFGSGRARNDIAEAIHRSLVRSSRLAPGLALADWLATKRLAWRASGPLRRFVHRQSIL